MVGEEKKAAFKAEKAKLSEGVSHHLHQLSTFIIFGLLRYCVMCHLTIL